jgi:D-glycero-alpha-D-manno-heptose-7-phosphate kinase
VSGPAPRRIQSTAPIRIADAGGWTDTWFAGHGRIFHIAVRPFVEVRLDVRPRIRRDEPMVINAENYGERYPRRGSPGVWDRHPLIEAALEALPIPENLSCELLIRSEAPAGASTGTSAALAVAVLGAVARLTGTPLAPREVAALAHRVEVDRLGWQSGIQDQLCAALGGVNYIEMTAYPEARVTALEAPDDTWADLDRRLALIYLGRAHLSSAVHEAVIASLEQAGGAARVLERLREAADQARDAFVAGDLDALGRALTANTEAQALLHRSAVSDEARRVWHAAHRHGACGWKVNGAGGEGGSVTLLAGPDADDRRRMLHAVTSECPAVRIVPIRISRQGLQVWELPPEPPRG